MKIKEMVEKLPELAELYLSEIDKQKIENLLNEHSDSERECQIIITVNSSELVNKINKLCRFVSLFVLVVLSSTHYT